MRKWIFGLISVTLIVVFIRLGLWQVDRLHQRRALNAEVTAQLELPPVRLGDVDSLPVYRRVQGSGVYDTGVTLVEVLRAWNGVPGVYLVSPLVMANGRAVLVERGWVGSQDARSVDLTSLAWTDTTAIVGFVTPILARDAPYDSTWPKYVREADPRAMTGVVPYRVLPFLVRRTGGPDRAAIEALDEPVLSDGPHLNYAVQWFAFALVAIVGTVVYLRKNEP